MQEKQKSNEVLASENQRLERDNDQILTQYLYANNDNNMLRGKQKHCLRLGNIRIEVIPSAESSTQDVLKGFIKFAKEMKKLHGNAHLEGQPDTPNQMVLDAMVG